MNVRTRLMAGRPGRGACGGAGRDAGSGGDAQARRHADLHDPGRRAAELRRPPRDHLRHGPCRSAVLQRADPRPARQSGLDHRVRLRSLHRDAQADRRRQDLHLQDPRGREVPRRHASSPRRTWRRAGTTSSSRPRASISARVSYYEMVDKIEAPDDDDRGVPPEARHDGLPAGARRSLHLDLQEGDPREGSALVREEHHGLRPVQVRRPTRSASRSRACATPTTTTRASPISTRIEGIFADKQSVRVDALRGDRAAIEFRGLPPSARDQLVKEAGNNDRRAGQRLELRQPPHAQPQEEAVRRRARAPRAGARHRPVEGRAGAGQDRHRPHGGRHRLPRLAARRDQGGAAADRGLLARHREVARRGQAPAEGGRRRGAEVRADSTATSTSPTSTSAPGRSTSGSKIGLNVEQKVVPTGPWFRGDARRHLRRGRRGQLPERGQPAARYRQVPAGARSFPRTTAATTTPSRSSSTRRCSTRPIRSKQRAAMRAFEKHTLDTEAHEIVHALLVPHHRWRGPT